MRIWFQLLSSETGLRRFLDTTQKVVDRAVLPDTKVEVRGTTHGVLGDQYRIFCNYDSREILDNALAIRRDNSHDAFVIANSLDPALVELREMLDIPVVSFMEVCCFTACTMGERFGVIGVNPKVLVRYREIILGYGLRHRLAALEAMEVQETRSLEGGFVAGGSGDALESQVRAAARRAVEKGAEVLFIGGPPGALMAERGIFEMEGVPLLDTYGLLAKWSEMMVTMHKLTGVCVSRKLLYAAPERGLIRQVAEAYEVDSLRDG
jgi:Asp/Glu/hydantoin racemase